MRKKIISVLLCISMCVCILAPLASARDLTPAEKAHLKFGDDGKFTILNYSDFQGTDKMDSMTKAFIRESLKELKPDLVVLTGDNIEGGDCKKDGAAEKAIDCFMSVFEEAGVPTAVVFGNHDHQCGISREDQIANIYSKYSVNLTYDEGEEIEHTGTYNIPIYSSNGLRVAFNIWMMDTGARADDGYDRVRPTQLDWYKKTSNTLKLMNFGKPVPSIVFQHIIVPEIYDVLEPVSVGTFGSVANEGKNYVLPKTATADSSLNEKPCPSGTNGGEVETMRAQGDVLAIVSGHDHSNSFVVDCDGIKLINTPTSGFGTYGYSSTRGVRVFTLDEKNPTEFETYVYLTKDCLQKNSPNEYAKSIFKGFFKGLVEFFNILWQKVESLFAGIKK